jgi:2-succinyl-5-enolpyruvyl-6-hydroxy-3-cyclohexene-1-carboxylate synthase
VHLNVALRDPLVPTDGEDWTSPIDVPIERELPGDLLQLVATHLDAGGNTVVVAGDGGRPDARALAHAAGWPLLAEPSSGHRAGPNALATYRLLLDHLGGEVERVVVVGRPTLSRQVSRLLARDDVEVMRLSDAMPTPGVTGNSDPAWLNRWLDADALADDAVSQVLVAEPVNGLSVARVVASTVPPGGLLVAGSSSSIRDLDLADPWESEPPLVLSNRGASGIDGTVSTAIGAALAHGGPAYALMGDLTFLHDSTGLVLGPDEPRPDLTVVVVNDDGGGLFTQLEQGAPEHARQFERVFGTPHGTDLGALCAATGTAHVLVEALDDLAAQLARPSGIRVVEVRADRGRTRDLHVRLRAAVEQALL